MSRYKGRQSAKALEQDFPRIVEMIVPEGGFGKTLDAMYDSTPAKAYEPLTQLGGAMRVAATTFAGALLIRLWLKRSRVSSHLWIQNEIIAATNSNTKHIRKNVHAVR
jgi:hypothetical protein